MKERCYTCEKGNLTKRKTEYKLYGVSLGRFNAEVCDRCEKFSLMKLNRKK